MSTFGNMVRRIRTDIGRGSAHDQRIKEAVCDAIAYFTPKRLGFNQKRAQRLIYPDAETISLPTDWLEVDHLRLERNTDREPLEEKDFDWIEDKMRGTPITGEPTHYAIHARELRFYPIPDRSYTLVMSFHCELPEVSVSAADDTSNAWMTEGEYLVRTYATGDLYVSYIGGSEVERGMALQAQAREDILPTLERRAARENTSGRVRAFL